MGFICKLCGEEIVEKSRHWPVFDKDIDASPYDERMVYAKDSEFLKVVVGCNCMSADCLIDMKLIEMAKDSESMISREASAYKEAIVIQSEAILEARDDG